MEKRKARAMVVAIFVVGLVTAAMVWDNTRSAEMAMLQGAMRELRRVDNLEFSYYSAMTGGGMQTGDFIKIWSDQLSGCWASEHYKTDEDGTRLYLKQFCDGEHVYNYIEWNGEWELQNTKDVEVPYLNSILSTSYDDGDIINLECVEEKEGQKISFEFTQEYIDNQNKERQKTVQASYDNYKKMASEELTDEMALNVEQYINTFGENTVVAYHMNEAGILDRVSCSMQLVRPEIIYGADGTLEFGAERESLFELEVIVDRYNQQGTLNKLEYCRNEILYQ